MQIRSSRLNEKDVFFYWMEKFPNKFGEDFKHLRFR